MTRRTSGLHKCKNKALKDHKNILQQALDNERRNDRTNTRIMLNTWTCWNVQSLRNTDLTEYTNALEQGLRNAGLTAWANERVGTGFEKHKPDWRHEPV